MPIAEPKMSECVPEGLGAIHTTPSRRLATAALRFLLLTGTLQVVGCGWLQDNTCAPPEAMKKEEYLRHTTPPAGYPAVVGWLIAVQDRSQSGPSMVEVDRMSVHAVIDGQDRVLLQDEFDTYDDRMRFYGLYRRNPWFVADYHEPMPFTVADGVLRIEPSTRADRIFHFWNVQRAIVPPGASRVWFEARVRIFGPAKLQAGLDYWRDLNVGYGGVNINNTEGGASDWLCDDTEGWTIITLGKP